ncbi:MAG: heme o synthase, partial [Chloroflexota bacterium]
GQYCLLDEKDLGMATIRRLAVASALATFLFVVVTGIVRVTGSGLACPDWPLCSGPSGSPWFMASWVIEGANHVVATVTVVLVAVTALYAWTRHRERRWILVPSVLALGLLAAQLLLDAFPASLGTLPGMASARVDLALLLFAAITVAAAGARWSSDPGRRFAVDFYAGLALATALLTYVLLAVGAYVTETSAALACGNWPFCGDGFQPPADVPSTVNLLHRVIAGLVTFFFLVLLARSRAARPAEKGLRGPLVAGLVLILAQITIGAGVVLWQAPPIAAILHLAVGCLFWCDLIAVTLLCCLPRVDARQPVVNHQLKESVLAYLNLTKPRIIVLLLITTLGGMVIAARGLPSLGLIAATIAGGALAAGSANAINCYIDRDIDQLMRRTRRRSLPRGSVSPENALLFGLTIGGISFAVLTVYANLLSAFLALAGLLFYVLVYTGVLKRSTPQNIVIGGAAGALPPMVGWAAVTGRVDLLAVYMFAVIFFWTPPHFWALSLLTSEDYARANVPMLPLIVGEGETRRQIFLYSILLVAVTMLMVSGRSLGFVYLIAALALGGGLIYYAARLLRDGSHVRARQLFSYTNMYLALIFLAMAIDRVVPLSL